MGLRICRRILRDVGKRDCRPTQFLRKLATLPPALQEAWSKLPVEFSRTEGLGRGIANNTLDRLIRAARPMGLLNQDAVTKRYRKIEPKAQAVGVVGKS